MCTVALVKKKNRGFLDLDVQGCLTKKACLEAHIKQLRTMTDVVDKSIAMGNADVCKKLHTLDTAVCNVSAAPVCNHANRLEHICNSITWFIFNL